MVTTPDYRIKEKIKNYRIRLDAIKSLFGSYQTNRTIISLERRIAYYEKILGEKNVSN